MSKKLKIVLLFTIIAAILLTCVACSLQKKYENAAGDYLKNKYPQRKFEMLSYEKDNNDTSGRYIVKIKCLNDNVTFDMYIYSSILITDSYNVDRANFNMKTLLKPILEDSGVEDKISNIEWLRKYNEESTDGSFISYDYPEDITIDNLKNSIYRVYIDETLELQDIAFVISRISRAFELNDKSLTIGFQFKYNNKNYVATLETSEVYLKEESYIQSSLETAIANVKPDTLYYLPLVIDLKKVK